MEEQNAGEIVQRLTFEEIVYFRDGIKETRRDIKFSERKIEIPSELTALREKLNGSVANFGIKINGNTYIAEGLQAQSGAPPQETKQALLEAKKSVDAAIENVQKGRGLGRALKMKEHVKSQVTAETIQRQSSATEQKTKFCGSCGNKLGAEAVFCSKCGAKTS